HKDDLPQQILLDRAAGFDHGHAGRGCGTRRVGLSGSGKDEWQSEIECAPRARLTFRPDPAAMGFDDAFGDGQSESRSRSRSVAGPGEAVEDVREICLWYSGS